MLLKKVRGLVLVLSAISIAGIIGGCGNSNEKSSEIDERSKISLNGEISVDGSSTVAPITEAMAEEFNIENKDVKIPVGVSGTGGGFKRFVVGETDIQDASRPIKEEEAKKASDNNVSYTDLTVAFDGVTVAVSKENDFVDTLTVEELKQLWMPDSTIKTWKDLREEWPNDEIKFYTPGPDSGTFEFFTEEIVGEARAMRSDVNPSEDDNVLVQGVSGDENAMGFFGFSYYKENEDKLKAIKIDNGDGGVEPTFDNIKKGTYVPLSREIYIYVNNESLERPEVDDFIKFYLTNATSIVSDVGYIPLTEAGYNEELEKLK